MAGSQTRVRKVFREIGVPSRVANTATQRSGQAEAVPPDGHRRLLPITRCRWLRAPRTRSRRVTTKTLGMVIDTRSDAVRDRQMRLRRREESVLAAAGDRRVFRLSPACSASMTLAATKATKES